MICHKELRGPHEIEIMANQLIKTASSNRGQPAMPSVDRSWFSSSRRWRSCSRGKLVRESRRHLERSKEINLGLGYGNPRLKNMCVNHCKSKSNFWIKLRIIFWYYQLGQGTFRATFGSKISMISTWAWLSLHTLHHKLASCCNIWTDMMHSSQRNAKN